MLDCYASLRNDQLGRICKQWSLSMLVPVACETLIGLPDVFVVRSFPAF